MMFAQPSARATGRPVCRKGICSTLSRKKFLEVTLGSMSSQLTRKSAPGDAGSEASQTRCRSHANCGKRFPDLHAGRILELAAINGNKVDHPLFGPLVELKLVVRENGQNSAASFVVLMSLQPDAAAAHAPQPHLQKLADDSTRNARATIGSMRVA